MKKLLALILALIMVLSFAACGGAEEEKNESPESSAPAEPNDSKDEQDNTASDISSTPVGGTNSEKAPSSNTSSKPSENKPQVSSEPAGTTSSKPVNGQPFECNFCGEQKTQIGHERDVTGEHIVICKECYDEYGDQIDALLDQLP